MSNIARVSIAALAGAMLLSSASIASAQSSANLSTGNKIVVVEGVKVRGAANGVVAGLQQKGARGTLVGGPIVMGGYTWWNVDYDTGTDGWSAEDFMQLSTVAIASPASNGVVAGVSTTDDQQALVATLQAQLQSLIEQLKALLASKGM